LARRLVFALLAFCLLAPASAGAAVTIGNNLAADPGGGLSSDCGSGDCTSTYILAQLPLGATAAGGLASPINGVVVRFRIKTIESTAAPNSARLRLAFASGGGQYVGDGTGATVPIANTAGIQTFNDRLPIRTGDMIGLEAVDAASTGKVILPAMFTGTTGASYLLWTNPRLADLGAPRAALSTPPDEELIMNADVEPDADHDGFGDETQDACPSNPSTQGACPAGGGGPPADRTAPVASLTARNSYSLRKTLRTGLTIRVSANEAGTASGTATFAGRLAATTTVAKGSASFSKPGRVKLKLTFTKKARRSLARKKRARLTLKVVVADRSGNRTTTTKRILLKR
jgi:hypothetical protein